MKKTVGVFVVFLAIMLIFAGYDNGGGETSFRVLKDDHVTAIGGLYAAGTDCLGVLLTEKKAYVTYGGLAQGWVFTSGRLAGEKAATGAKNN
jgi:fumarate reductase flavoprotein subunit